MKFWDAKYIFFEKSKISILLDEKVLGEGAFGIVLIGTDKTRKTKYAVKKIPINSPQCEIMVDIEIMSFQNFKHENILTCVDHKFSDESNSKCLYMLLPYMKHGTLRDKLNINIQSSNKFPIVDVLKSFISISHAFNVLHNYYPSYVHRDIKPENILLSDNGSPLLTDFGSVHIAEIKITTRLEALMVADEAAQYCTMPYRAPELFDPQKDTTLDTRTDVWGIGCLFFAWWFGYSPYECIFVTSGEGAKKKEQLQVCDSSYLRCLGPAPRPSMQTAHDAVILQLVDWVLIHDFTKRPFTADIILRLNATLSNLLNTDGKV